RVRRCLAWSLLPLLHITARSPSSPLFPYTTLFRSEREAEADPLAADRTVRSRGRDFRSPARVEQSLSGLGLQRSGNRRRRRGFPDRKSTRLNSSHVSISYAVFCLKKKKHSTQDCTR